MTPEGRLLEALSEIQAEASRAIQRLAFGEAKNGTSSLSKIRARADDAARHYREDTSRPATVGTTTERTEQ